MNSELEKREGLRVLDEKNQLQELPEKSHSCIKSRGGTWRTRILATNRHPYGVFHKTSP